MLTISTPNTVWDLAKIQSDMGKIAVQAIGEGDIDAVVNNRLLCRDRTLHQ